MRRLGMRCSARSGMALLAAAALALVLGAGEARANVIFTLTDVAFDDGTLATGTFTTNDALDTLLDYDITTAAGAISGFNYTPAGTVSFSSLPGILVVEVADLSHLLQITFDGGLTPTGAPVFIGQFDSFEQGENGVHRQITGGSVTVGGGSIPEPSSIALAFVAATAGLGVAARRRRTG